MFSLLSLGCACKKRNVAVVYSAQRSERDKSRLCLTVEGQIAEQGREEVHDVHNEDGDVRYLLHFLFRWAEIRQHLDSFDYKPYETNCMSSLFRLITMIRERELR